MWFVDYANYAVHGYSDQDLLNNSLIVASQAMMFFLIIPRLKDGGKFAIFKDLLKK